MDNVKRLPDAYYKGEDGNNYKLLHLNELAVTEFKTDMAAVSDCLDVMKSTGKTLDLYGEMVGQSRGKLDDAQYRLLILNKIGRNLCKGNYNDVIALLAQMFNAELSDIVFTEAEDPCKITIVKFPLDLLTNAGFSGEQTVLIIEMLLPVCIRLTDIEFNGTFEFMDGALTYGEMAASTYGDMNNVICELLPTFDYDAAAGFGNIEQTIGGTLSLAVSDSSTFDLPI